MDLSIIVCTYNRADKLDAIFSCFLIQDVPADLQYEILLVDNNSSDETRAVAEQYIPEFQGRLKYFFASKRGPAAARNCGIRNARSSVITFTDDDVILPKDWIRNLAEVTAKYEFDAMGGRVISEYTAATPKWVIDNKDLLAGPIVRHDYGNQVVEYTSTMSPFIGVSMVIKKSVFDSVGLFCEDLDAGRRILGEDTDMFHRIRQTGKKVLYCGLLAMRHPIDQHRTTTGYVARWFFANGRYEVKKNSDLQKDRFICYGGIPRFFFKQIGIDILVLVFVFTDRKKLIRRWVQLSRNTGMAYEHYRQARIAKGRAGKYKGRVLREVFKVLFLKIERVLLRILKRKKDVLCVILNETMLTYVVPILDRLSRDKAIRVWVHFQDLNRIKNINAIKVAREHRWRVASRFMANSFKWDVVLYPDHGTWTRSDCCRLYVGHGLPINTLVDGDSYRFGQLAYGGRGEILYEKFFVSSEYEAASVRRRFPEFTPLTKVVGSWKLDQTLSYCKDRESILSDAGLSLTKKTIMVASTWKEHSLVQRYGCQLFEELKQLSEFFNVLITIHENNFLEEYSGGVDWAEKLRELEDHNIKVLFDRESPFKFLAAADVFISDFTSLSLYFAALNRPSILFCDEQVAFGEDSLIFELKQIAKAPSNEIFNLKEDILQAAEEFDLDRSKKLTGKIASYPGESLKRCLSEIYDSLKG